MIVAVSTRFPARWSDSAGIPQSSCAVARIAPRTSRPLFLAVSVSMTTAHVVSPSGGGGGGGGGADHYVAQQGDSLGPLPSVRRGGQFSQHLPARNHSLEPSVPSLLQRLGESIQPGVVERAAVPRDEYGVGGGKMRVEPFKTSPRVEIGTGPTDGIVVHAPQRSERSVEHDRKQRRHHDQTEDRPA